MDYSLERMIPTDDALLSAFRSGDDHALAQLLERHAPAVYRFGVTMCRDPEDTRDVVQDTLLAAARGLHEFRGGASLSTWLFTIARSFCIKKRRRRAGAPSELVSLEADDARAVATEAVPPDEAAGDREIGAALDAAIGALEPMYREVLVLRDVEGLTAQEVASVLGVTVDAVKSRLHRARLAVRDRLAPLPIPSEPAALPGCPDLVPILSQYLEGEIGPDQCAAMERHVAQCLRCQARCGGFGWLVTVFFVFSAVFVWHLGGADLRTRRVLAPVTWTLFLSYVASLVLSWAYFFPAPIVFSTAITGLLGLACMQNRRAGQKA